MITICRTLFCYKIKKKKPIQTVVWVGFYHGVTSQEHLVRQIIHSFPGSVKGIFHTFSDTVHRVVYGITGIV